MKVPVTMLVSRCDRCKGERATKQCAGCGKDACEACSLDYVVRGERWHENQMLNGISSGPIRLQMRATYCEDCTPEHVMRGAGFRHENEAAQIFKMEKQP